MSHRDFPTSEWPGGSDCGSLDELPSQMDFGAPRVHPSASAATPEFAAKSHTKNVCMVLAMGLALLASQKPLTFSWLVHESLPYLPTLVLAFGLMQVARLEKTLRRTSPEVMRGVLALMAAAALAVLGVPGA